MVSLLRNNIGCETNTFGPGQSTGNFVRLKLANKRFFSFFLYKPFFGYRRNCLQVLALSPQLKKDQQNFPQLSTRRERIKRGIQLAVR